MKEINHDFLVSGRGNTRIQAFQKAFSKMRKEMNDLNLGYIIHAQPLDVKIENEMEVKYTEKFMFFFLPREKSTFEISLNIKVNIKYM